MNNRTRQTEFRLTVLYHGQDGTRVSERYLSSKVALANAYRKIRNSNHDSILAIQATAWGRIIMDWNRRRDT